MLPTHTYIYMHRYIHIYIYICNDVLHYAPYRPRPLTPIPELPNAKLVTLNIAHTSIFMHPIKSTRILTPVQSIRRESHVETLIIYNLCFNRSYYTFALILLTEIVLCSKFH